MLNKNRVLQQFAIKGIGGLIITDRDQNIVYHFGKPEVDQEHWNKWSVASCPVDEMIEGQDTEWEIAEKEAGLYYRVRSALIIDDGEAWQVHHIYDLSDFAALFHDLTMYYRDWHTLSSCQQEIIESLRKDCKAILPIAIKYLKTEHVLLFIDRRNDLERYEQRNDGSRIFSQKIVSKAMECQYKAGEKYKLSDMEGEYLCYAGGDTVSGEKYALLVKTGENEPDDIMYPLYFNIFKLFIENSLLRENVTYESEHDHLTGLYNKGKYLELLKRDFPFYNTIAVFNMDLNYLKRTNDTLGHEAGNKLLKKAADSLKAVSGDGVYSFRLGGDEFMLVVADASEEKVREIKEEWERNLKELNADDSDPECVIACGLVFAKKPYDLADILGKADMLMYRDKRAIKISRGEDPNGR